MQHVTAAQRGKWAWGATVVTLCLVALTGCAGENPLVGSYGRTGVAGFWAGLWHGLTMGPAFVISLFRPDVSVYEVHNSGRLYDLGFVLGVGTGAGMLGMARGGSDAPPSTDDFENATDNEEDPELDAGESPEDEEL